MTIWKVYGYVRTPSRHNYDGFGTRQHIMRDFTDQPSARRFAQHLCETGKADPVSVEEWTDGQPPTIGDDNG